MPVAKKIAQATSSLLSLKRPKPCLDLGDTLAEATPAFVAQTNMRETVDYYDRHDIKVGKVLQSGQFFEWHKIKRLPDQEASENSSTGSFASDNSKKRHHMTQQYILKQVNPKIFASSQKRALEEAALRLVLEAKLMARLHHPNILQAKGLPLGEEVVLQRESVDAFFVVAPRVVETLEARLSRWRQFQGDRKIEVETFDETSVTFQRKLRYAKELAEAVAYLQKKNLVLLNLNPQSIGFLESGTLQITDLTCCREVDPEERGAAMLDESEMDRLALAHKTRTTDVTTNYLLEFAVADGGVPRHVAPEVILHDLYTPQADTYSWSLILFELLTLSQPYITYKAGQHLTKVCVQGQRPNLSVYRLPKELQTLLCKTWCPSVSKRPFMSRVLAAIPTPKPRAVTVANPQA